MIIGERKYEQIVITGPNPKGSIVTADDNREVIAIITDDDKVVVKNGYEVRLIPAPEDN